MHQTIWTVLLSLALWACGGAPPPSTTTSSESARSSDSVDGVDDFSSVELAKLGDVLRDRLDAAETHIYPVRVKFRAGPPRAELTELFLVALDGDAVGRVDRATLKQIAAREDVTHIVYINAGYAEDDHELD